MDPYAKQQERHSMLAVKDGVPDSSRGPTHGRKPKDYKPAPIRWPTLVLFALILAACIGLIELLFGMTKEAPGLEIHNRARSIDSVPNQLIPRDDGDCTKLPALVTSFSSANQVMASLCAAFTQTYSGKVLNLNQTAAFDKWLDTYTTQDDSRYAIYSSMTLANDDCYENQMTTVAGYRPIPTVTKTYYYGCRTITTTADCVDEQVVITTVDRTVEVSTRTAACSAPLSKQLTLKTKPTTASTAPLSKQLTLETKSPSPNPGSATPSANQGSATPSANQGSVTPTPSVLPVTLTSKITSSSIIITTGANGVVSTQTSLYVQTSLVTTSSTVKGGSNTASPSQSRGDILPTSTNSPDASILDLTPHEKYVDRPITMANYVSAMYLPAILAVLIRVVWESIHAAFKLVEPFHRLSKKGGSSATQSLFAQYLSASVSWDSLGACFSGHALAAVTTIIYFAVTWLPSLASASMNIQGTDICEVEGGHTMVCNPVWVIQTVFLRAVEGLLILCFALTVSLTILSKWYKTGVSTDPSSIASVATLVNQDALVHNFRLISPTVDNAGLIAAIKGERCWLGYHQSNTRGPVYGIGRRIDPVSYPSPIGQPTQGWNNGYSTVANPALPPPKNGKSRKFGLMSLNVIQLISSVAIFGLVVAYYKDDSESAFNNFFNSGSWYSQFLFVLGATLVDMQWKRLEREVRIIEPYRRMSKGFARPETTVLATLHGSCWSSFFSASVQMFRYKEMWFQALVSFVAVLSDFNIIAFASIVFSSAQLPESARIASMIAMAITALMVIVMLITVFWWSRGIVTEMPRTPSTVGAVFSYLCASRFAQEMGSARLEGMSQKERDDMIIATGWRFSFGWQAGVDGIERWMVDFRT